MKKTILVSLLAGLGLAFTQAPALAAASAFAGKSQYVPDQILVKFKPGVAATSRAQMAQSYGAQTMQALGNKSDVVLAKLATGRTVEQAVAAYKNDPNVAYVQPDYIYHIQSVPTDPRYGDLWAAKNTGQAILGATYPFTYNGTPGNDMNLESAWNVKTDCRSVVVAVVDSGVNYNSEDLLANMWSGNANHGQNFASDGVAGDPMDLHGHGTHVAGIIGAVGNNAKGGVGVCWQASIMAVRVMNALGSGSTSTIIQGINYAVTNGAKVINMSLGGTGGFDQAYSDAITNAQTNNVLVVVAAGNDNQNNETTPHWPCNFTHANLICVAALDQNYALATFSDYGSTSVDVGAPGTNIYSTWAGTSAVAFTDIVGPGFAAAGWNSSTWAYDSGGYLIDPTGTWGTTLYANNIDDRVYKSFNLGSANSAYVEFDALLNVKSGDYFNFNYINTAVDPFAGSGTAIGYATGIQDDKFLPLNTYGKFNITPCISATCTLGFQLISDSSVSANDFGVLLSNLKITTMTNNATSYNTIDGTSMATPEVAGVAALVWAHNPLYTYADVANAIKNGGRTTASLSGKTTTGKAVDAMGSLSYINPPTGIAVVVH